MAIRDLGQADLPAALALNNANVPAVSELDAPELARLTSLTSVALVADLDDGSFGGFCMVMPPGVDYASVNYRWFTDHAAGLGHADFAYLDRIAVAPAARRRGVGRGFYARLVDALSGRASVLFCEVNVEPRNDISLAFHESVGFRSVGELDSPDGTKRVSLLALELPDI
ncbi:MAG: GNAT family N-acetyltransferase [Ilumatobacteraceae bacterium]